MDVGGTAIKSAMIDDSDILSDTRVTPSDRDATARTYKALEVAKSYGDFDAVSVATTGQVDIDSQEVLFQYGKRNEPDHGSYSFGEILQSAIDRPVFVLNDCNAAALGEAHFGAGKDFNSFLCLSYGTGVGGAIIEGKRLYTGRRGIAGEMGHMVTHKGGRLCGCGGRGRYEQYASTTALLKSARKLIPQLENAKEIFCEENLTPEMNRVIRSWESEIVAGLFTLTYIFNPQALILGGGIMEQNAVIEGVRRLYYKGVIPTFKNVSLLSAGLGNQAGMYGAAVYARQCLGIM